MKLLLAALAFAVFAATAHAAPQQQIPIVSQGYILVLMNTDTTYVLPTTPSWSMGYPIQIYDNLGSAGGSNISVTGGLGGTKTISTNYGSLTMRWTGAGWQ